MVDRKRKRHEQLSSRRHTIPYHHTSPVVAMGHGYSSHSPGQDPSVGSGSASRPGSASGARNNNARHSRSNSEAAAYHAAHATSSMTTTQEDDEKETDSAEAVEAARRRAAASLHALNVSDDGDVEVEEANGPSATNVTLTPATPRDAVLDSLIAAATADSSAPPGVSTLQFSVEFSPPPLERIGAPTMSPLGSPAAAAMSPGGSSASTFSQLHTSSSGTLAVPKGTSFSMGHMSRSISAPMSQHALDTVSIAIHEGLSGRTAPNTPSLCTSDIVQQKLVLLTSLFQSIDKDSNGYLARDELINWVEHEPWLAAEGTRQETERMLLDVTHDEDSRCSKNEFIASFDTFSTAAVITLVVNLLRAGMVSKVPSVCYVYNAHDPYLNPSPTERFDQIRDHSPMESPEPGAHTDLSVHDTPAHTLVFGANRLEAEKHFFIIDVLFQSMDRDLDSQLDVKDLTRWLRADPWIHATENFEIFTAVDACWRELTSRNAAAGFVPPPDADDCSIDGIGPARLDKHFFFVMFSQVPKREIRKLLVHLLSRNASNVIEEAETARIEAKSKKNDATLPAGGLDGVALVTLQTPAGLAALSGYPYPLTRRHSVVTGGARRVSVSDGLRVTLVGQAMIQHDMRSSKLGAQTLQELAPLLKADVVFTELETSIIRPGQQAEATRNTVFFHAAGPEVIDNLVEMGFNMVATANNHAGDLGEVGIQTLLEEFEQRDLCMAGIGHDAAHAARAAFLDTENGRIAQVCFASKIPENSIARENQAGVNSLSMVDVDTNTLNPVELNRIIGAIEDARDGFVDPDTHEHMPKADMIIAYHHNHYWEKNAKVNQIGAFGYWKRELAHRMIDAGAHVYVAHGDPRLQGIEIYRGSPILYCLGNFVFQTKTAISFYGDEVWQSVIVQLHCHDIAEATSYSIRLVPIVLNEVGETQENHLQTRGLPRLASRTVGAQILQKLQRLSEGFGTNIHVEDSVEGDSTSPVIGWVLSGSATVRKLTMRLPPMGETFELPPDGLPLSSPVTLQSAPTSPPTTAASSLPASDFELTKAPYSAPSLLRELSPQAAVFPDDVDFAN